MSLFAAHTPLVRNASAEAADLIRQAIFDGRLGPGERLKEEELARQLHISRTPVREALLILQTEGIVEASPNRGATVRTYEPPEMQEMYELRALLEGEAARRAATRIDSDGLQRLHESCNRFEKLTGDSFAAPRVAENAVFHETILAAAGSPRLAGMLRQVVAVDFSLPLIYRTHAWYSPELGQASYRSHRQLTNALKRRDPTRAESIMREHVWETWDLLAQRMEAILAPTGAIT